MQLDSRTLWSPACPVKKRLTQPDHSGIQQIELVAKPSRQSCHQCITTFGQHRKERSDHLRRSSGIRMGNGGAIHTADAIARQQTATHLKAGLDTAQTAAVRQQRQGQATEVRPTRRHVHLVIATTARHGLRKGGRRQPRLQLLKKSNTLGHSLSLRKRIWVLDNTQGTLFQ